MTENQLAQVNEAISLPSEWIRTNDGRELLIRQWTPNVEHGKVVEISMVVVVKMPNGDIAHP